MFPVFLMFNTGEILKLIITNLCTLLAAYMMFTGTVDKNDNELLANMWERQAIMEKANSDLMSKVMTLGVQNVELQARLRDNITRTDLYQVFLDGLPFPAWIKQRNSEGVFVMVMINTAYEHRFGVSKARYEGSTDEEIWGAEVSQGFFISDNDVFVSKGYTLTREYFPSTAGGSDPAWYSVWKFSLKLGDNKYGVGGVMVVDFDHSGTLIKTVEKYKSEG